MHQSPLEEKTTILLSVLTHSCLHMCLTNNRLLLLSVFQACTVQLVCVVRHCWGGMLVLVVLHPDVRHHGQQKHCDEDVEFGGQTDVCAVGEGYHKAQRLPHAIISKRCLLVVREQSAVQCCDGGKKNIMESYSEEWTPKSNIQLHKPSILTS